VRWSTGTVESQGERIYFEVTVPVAAPHGTVVLGHGAGGTHAAWFQQVPFLAGAGWRVITWDTRGFGNSTFATGVLTTDAAVGDLGAVLDATDTATAHVVGQSMGGWWAAAFALAHPERVASLVLANTVGGLWTPDLVAHFGSLAAPDAAPDATDTPTASAESAPAGLPLGRHSAIGPQLPERDLALAFLYQQLNTFHDPPMAAVIRALTGTRVAPRSVAALPFAKLWISATHDELFPARLIEPVAAEAGARFELIADAGHSPYFERAGEWNARLAVFLDEVVTIPR
jgi:3-oxoadipate enol-lactonase